MRPARGQLIGVGRSRRRSLGRWAQCIHSTLYTGPLLIRGKSDCWPLQLLELDYQHCPHAPSVSWHKCSELTAVQCSADTRHATVKSTQSQPLCTSAKSEIQLMVDRNADSSRQTWSCELQSSDPNRSWQKFSFHSSYLTDVQLI